MAWALLAPPDGGQASLWSPRGLHGPLSTWSGLCVASARAMTVDGIMRRIGRIVSVQLARARRVTSWLLASVDVAMGRGVRWAERAGGRAPDCTPHPPRERASDSLGSGRRSRTLRKKHHCRQEVSADLCKPWVQLLAPPANVQALLDLKYCFEKLSNRCRCIHCRLVVEMAYTTLQSLKTRPGHQLPLLGALNASCRGHEVVLSDVEVTTFNSQCNRLQVIEDGCSGPLARSCDYFFSLVAKFYFKHRCK